jgi:hypothetical protein
MCRVRSSIFKRQIHQDDIGHQLERLLDRFQTVGRLRNPVSRELQIRGVHLPRILVILDDEHEWSLYFFHWLGLSGAVLVPAASA